MCLWVHTRQPLVVWGLLSPFSVLQLEPLALVAGLGSQGLYSHPAHVPHFLKEKTRAEDVGWVHPL